MTSLFVVGLDREGVLRRRAAVRRTRLIGGWFSFGLAVVGMMAPLSLLFLGVDGIWVITAVLSPAMLPLVLVTGWALWRTAKLGQWHAATDVPPFAMRMSPAALELGCEGTTAPVVLPWHTVPGFRVRRRYGQLALEVASRIHPATPGVVGLDQPAAASVLAGELLLKPAGFYSLEVLDQPVAAIDAALRSFSGGRVGILAVDTPGELRLKAWLLLALAVLIGVIGLFVLFWWRSPVVGISVLIGGSLLFSPAASRFRTAQQLSARNR